MLGRLWSSMTRLGRTQLRDGAVRGCPVPTGIQLSQIPAFPPSCSAPLAQPELKGEPFVPELLFRNRNHRNRNCTFRLRLSLWGYSENRGEQPNFGNSQMRFPPERAFQPGTKCVSFEFRYCHSCGPRALHERHVSKE